MQLVGDLSGASPNAAGTIAGSTVGPNPSYTVNTDLSRYDQICVAFTTLGATGGTLDIYIQNSPDDGISWNDWAHPLQIAAAAGAASFDVPMFTRTSFQAVTIGTGLTPALAAGAGVGSHPGDRMRVVFVAGAGTTAGAVQTIKVWGVERMNLNR